MIDPFYYPKDYWRQTNNIKGNLTEFKLSPQNKKSVTNSELSLERKLHAKFKYSKQSTAEKQETLCQRFKKPKHILTFHKYSECGKNK
jgi:hypothetical protein